MKTKFSFFKGILLLFLMFTKVSAQTIFSINQEIANSRDFPSATPILAPVEYRDVEINNQKRKAYILLEDEDIPITSEKAFGDYKEISSNIGFTREKIADKFVPYEVSDEITKYFNVDTKTLTLIENINTHKFYVIMYSTFSSILKIDKNKKDGQNITELLKSLGYEPYTDNNFLFVNTKYYMVNCNAILYNTLKEDRDYLKKLDASYLKLANLKKQAYVYNPKFENYMRIYKIQRNKMSKADIAGWTSLTKSGLVLLKQIADMNDKLWDGIDHYDLDKSSDVKANNFADYVGTSRNILGL